MYYGSAFDGIHPVKLNAATGLNATPGDCGPRIAQRGFTGTANNGNIEGPEIIYNKEQGKYYLFISYDWLQTKYNVRVGRADSPAGPFLDFNCHDINLVFTQSPYLPAPADSVRVPVALAELGLPPGSTVQDLWSGRSRGAVSGEFAPYIRRHGAGFYRISSPKTRK